MFDEWPIHERDAYAPPSDSTGADQLGGIIDSLLLTPFWEITDTVTVRNPQKCGCQLLGEAQYCLHVDKPSGDVLLRAGHVFVVCEPQQRHEKHQGFFVLTNLAFMIQDPQTAGSGESRFGLSPRHARAIGV
jgi:hypothetical protein